MFHVNLIILYNIDVHIFHRTLLLWRNFVISHLMLPQFLEKSISSEIKLMIYDKIAVPAASPACNLDFKK